MLLICIALILLVIGVFLMIILHNKTGVRLYWAFFILASITIASGVIMIHNCMHTEIIDKGRFELERLKTNQSDDIFYMYKDLESDGKYNFCYQDQDKTKKVMLDLSIHSLKYIEDEDAYVIVKEKRSIPDNQLVAILLGKDGVYLETSYSVYINEEYILEISFN